MIEELTKLLSPVVAQFGLDLDDLHLSKAGKRRVLEIVLDGDDGVNLDQVAEVSRAVSEYLDSTEIMGEMAYLLEVGSRGVGRPLVKPIHWERNIARLVEVSGKAINVNGRIVDFENPNVTLEVDGKNLVVDISTISRAMIEVEFNRKVVDEDLVDEDIVDEDIVDEEFSQGEI